MSEPHTTAAALNYLDELLQPRLVRPQLHLETDEFSVPSSNDKTLRELILVENSPAKS